MSPDALIPVVLASLVGSVHCAGMCGGFVAAYAGDTGARAGFTSHLSYNLARLVTYGALGAVSGMIGSALDLAGEAAGLSRLAALMTGVSLLTLGIAKLVRRPKLITLRTSAPRGPMRWFGRLLASVHSRPKPVRAALLGLGSALLPCGWLYSFAVLAAGTGSAARGALLMAAFWLGSVPAMLGVGLSLAWLGARLQKVLPRLGAATLLALGLTTLVVRSSSPAFAPAVEQGAGACPLHHGSVP